MSSLPSSDFDFIRRHTPLVSIDLVILNPAGHALLGRRANQPAQGYWFVPGGRIRKDETLSNAFRRIVTTELGTTSPATFTLNSSRFLGLFEHHYPAGSDVGAFSIHYVVLAYQITLPDLDLSTLSTDQHTEWKWVHPDTALQDSSVHPYTKRYFERRTHMLHREQYDVVAHRRTSHDNLLWQTPVLSLTAQAFLFTIAFNDQNFAITRLPASILIVAVAYASIQLMHKHRLYEKDSSELLHEFENASHSDFAVVHRRLEGHSAFRLWICLLWIFLVVGIWAFGMCMWQLGCQYGYPSSTFSRRDTPQTELPERTTSMPSPAIRSGTGPKQQIEPEPSREQTSQTMPTPIPRLFERVAPAPEPPPLPVPESKPEACDTDCSLRRATEGARIRPASSLFFAPGADPL